MKLSKISIFGAALLTLAACGGNSEPTNYKLEQEETNLAYYEANKENMIAHMSSYYFIKTGVFSRETEAFTYFSISSEDYDLQDGKGKWTLYRYEFGFFDDDANSDEIFFYTGDKDNKDKVRSSYGYKFDGLYHFTDGRNGKLNPDLNIEVTNHLITNFEYDGNYGTAKVGKTIVQKSAIFTTAVSNAVDYFTANNLTMPW